MTWLRRTMRIARGFLVGVAVVLVIILVAVAGVLGWLHTDHGRGWLVAQVEEQVGTLADLDLEIGTLRGSLLHDLELRDVRLATRGAAESWISVDALRLGWRPWALVGARVRVAHLEIDAPRVDQRQMPAFPTSTDTTATTTDEAAGLPIGIALERLVITDGVVVAAQDVTLDSIQVAGAARAEAGDDLIAHLWLTGLAARWVEQDAALEAVTADIAVHGLEPLAPVGELTADLRWRQTTAGIEATLADGGYRATVSAGVPAGELGVLRDELAAHPRTEVAVTASGSLDFESLSHLVDVELGSPAGRLTLHAELEPKTGSAGGSADATALLATTALAARFAIDALEPARFWSGAPATVVSASGAAELSALGDPLAAANAGLVVEPMTIGELSINGARLAARAADGVVLVDSLRIDADATHVDVRGRFRDLNDVAATVDAHVTDLGVWSELVGRPLAGAIDLEADVTGGVRGFDGDIVLLADGVATDPISLEHIDARVTARGDTSEMQIDAAIELEALRAAVAVIESADVEAEATLVSLRPRALVASIEAQVDTIAGVPQLDRAHFVTRARGRMAGDGLSAQIDELALRQQDGEALVELTAPLAFDVRGSAIDVRGLALELPSGRMAGDVVLSETDIDADLRIETIDLAEVGALVPQLPAVAGIVDARVVLGTEGDDVSGTVEIGVVDLVYQERGPLKAALRADADPTGVGVEFAAVGAGDDSVTVSGRVPLVLTPGAPYWSWAEDPFDLTLTAVMDTVLHWTLGALARGARVDLGMRVGGTASDVTVDLDSRILPPTIEGLEALRLAVDARVAGGTARVLVVGKDHEQTLLTQDVSLPLLVDVVNGVAIDSSAAFSGTLDLNSFDLAYLATLYGEDVTVEGILDVHSTVGGTLDAPDFEGTLGLKDGLVELSALTFKLTDIIIDATFSKDRIEIREGRGSTPQGEVNLSGSVPTPLTPDEEVNFMLDARGLEFDMHPVKRASADLALKLGGKLSHPELGGTITINTATIQLPDRGGGREYLKLTPEELAQFEPPDTTQNVGGEEPPPFDLDLRVEIPRAFFIRNRMVNIEIGGGLSLVARNDLAVLDGELQTIRGRVEFAGQRFEVERGLVSFHGDAIPVLDVDATHTVDQWRIHILVTGSATEPEIALESNPPLPESDIMSLLLFGRRSGDLNSQEQFTLADRATSMVAGMATAGLETALANQLGLDLVEINPTGAKSSVTVGKYVNPRTLVKVEQGLQNANQREIAVEYSLTRNLVLEASTDDRGESGADILYDIDKGR